MAAPIGAALCLQKNVTSIQNRESGASRATSRNVIHPRLRAEMHFSAQARLPTAGRPTLLKYTSACKHKHSLWSSGVRDKNRIRKENFAKAQNRNKSINHS